MNLPNHFNWIPAKGKIPLVKWSEFVDRFASNEERAAWETAYPNSDRGVVCGPVSRIFVLDDDGSEVLKQYRIPRTATVNTPRGGKHHYFRWTPELDGKVTTKVGVLPSVDVRGYGGFVAFYGWAIPPYIAPLAFPPQWLIDLLPNRDTNSSRVIPSGFAEKPQDWMLTDLEAVDPSDPIHGRTPTFVRAIGRLKAKGLSEVEVKGLLAPWAAKYEYLKLDSLVEDQYQRYPQRQETTSETTAQQAENAEAFLADEPPITWLCHPFITDQTIGFIAGLPESRKSWIMADLAIEIARGGGLWLNKFPVKGGKVLLIDQERSKPEAQRRMRALLAAKGLSAKDVRSSLFARSGTSTRLDLQPSYDAFRKEMSELQPNIVLIDSFATFHTKNDGNRYEIQPVMERVKELRNEFKCAVIFIHHETKAAYQSKKEGAQSTYLDMAGNVAIPAAAEFCMNAVSFDADSSMCHHTKSTQGPKAAPFNVRVRDTAPAGSQIVVEAS